MPQETDTSIILDLLNDIEMSTDNEILFRFRMINETHKILWYSSLTALCGLFCLLQLWCEELYMIRCCILVSFFCMWHSYIALVDWIFGPYRVSFEQYFYGNWDNAPLIFLFDQLSNIIPSYVLQYVFLWAIFVLWLVSMFWCLRRFSSKVWIQIVGAFLFILTPWVYDRIFFWQVWVVAAYMFLPVVVWLARDLLDRKLTIQYALAMIGSLFFLGMLNARYFPIGLLLFASFFAYRLRKQRTLAVVYYGLLVVFASVALSSYRIMPLLYGDIVHSLADISQMQFFSPRGAIRDILVDTFALNNSWMNYKTQILVPLSDVYWLPWIFAGIYSFFSVTALFIWRHSALYILFFWSIFSAFFSLNLATPFLAKVNLWLFTTIPLFSAYREPGKRMALVAIFYVICIAIVLGKPMHRRLHWIMKWLIFVLLIASVYIFAFLPWENDWFIQYPDDWYEAKMLHAEILNNSGTIALPRHWYMGCAFNDRRIVQNPAKVFFWPEIQYGDNMEWWWIYSYSTKPLSQDLANILSQPYTPIDIPALVDTLRLHNIGYIAYFPTCAGGIRYKGLLDASDMVYSGTNIKLLHISPL